MLGEQMMSERPRSFPADASLEAPAAGAAGRRWLLVSYVYALVVAAGLSYFLLRVPIQLTDSFANMLALHKPWSEFLGGGSEDQAYFRHGLWITLKLLYELSQGEYFLWFRLTQAAQVTLLLYFFVRLLQPTRAVSAAAIPLGLAVLIGHHTFAWTVREAYPVNTFLTVLVCCAAAANLSFSKHRPWIDVVGVALLIFAASTVESGLLVWVIFAAGYGLGLRGISGKGLAAASLCLVGYFVIRASSGVGLPGLVARESGFGFTRYTGQQLEQMFGDMPYVFYLYNVTASALGVLLAEPRDGTWRIVAAIVEGERFVPAALRVVSTGLASLLLCGFAWVRRHEWRRLRFERSDHLVLLFGAVLAANAAMSYAYTKDVIMSPAGLFFAAAVCGASSELVAALAARRVRFARLAWTFLIVLSCAWAFRYVGLHVGLAATAVVVREQWADFESWAARRVVVLDAKGLALKEMLQADAIVRHRAKPPLKDVWLVAFDVD